MGISVHLLQPQSWYAQSSVMLWISVQINIWTMQYVSCILVTNSPHAGDARFAVSRRDRKTFDSMHHCTWLQGFIYYFERGTFYIVNASCHLTNHANGARVSKSYNMVTNMISSSSNSQNSSRGWNFYSWPSANIMTSSFQCAIISAKYPQLQYKMIDTRPKVFRTKPFHIMAGTLRHHEHWKPQEQFRICGDDKPDSVAVGQSFFPNRI